MDDDLHTLLLNNKIFTSLPRRIIRNLLPQFQKMELSSNEILYYQGDPSDSIAVLLSGKLESILTTANGENKIIGEILPGESVGEMGALSGEPRTSTIKAVKDSILFNLPNEIFIELCHAYPPILFAAIHPIVSHSQKMLELVSDEKFKRHIAIFPANEEVSLDIFAKVLNQQVSGLVSLVLISEYNNNELTLQKIKEIIDDAKIKNVKRLKQKFIYLLKSEHSVLSDFCSDKIEMIYIVGNKTSSVSINNWVLEKIQQFRANSKIKPELILLHDDFTLLPRNTAPWLKLTDFALHHHIRMTRISDYNRLIRFIRNKAIGLVLSGGGTRGWGHAGAIKALSEVGIPIDAIGGTSVGSIVAASYALTESPEETLAQFEAVIEASRDSVTWRSLTWPAISIYNAKSLTTIIEKLFDFQIEDLWLPYFCISTNLASNTEGIHQSGTLWERIRASIALPGIIPPMLLKHELHIDGSLLNNLPSDIMRKIVGHKGNVIAVELVNNINDPHKYDFPPILTFWPTLLAKLGKTPNYKFPRFLDTFLKSLLVVSSVKAQQNSLNANLYISLDLSQFPMLHSNIKLEKRIVDIGYQTTINQIKHMQQKQPETTMGIHST